MKDKRKGAGVDREKAAFRGQSSNGGLPAGKGEGGRKEDWVGRSSDCDTALRTSQSAQWEASA